MSTSLSCEQGSRKTDQVIAPVPGYDTVVERNQIDMLLQTGDWVLKNGDLALTRWGDIMLNNEDYSAFSALVQKWRFNYPTLRVMFETAFGSIERQRQIDREAEQSFPAATNMYPHPAFNPSFDPTVFHRAMDEHGSAEVAKGTYAGSVAIVIVKLLQSFKDNIAATDDEWKQSAPLFNECSLGVVLEASANNARHSDEWWKTRPPNRRQLKSITILSAALREPIAPDGKGHKFAREVSPEILQLTSGGDFFALESAIFAFAKNLMSHRQLRMPTQ